MASETSKIYSQIQTVLISSDSDEELIGPDYSAKNMSGKKAPLMAPSSTRKRRQVLSDDEEESVVRTKAATIADEEQNEPDCTVCTPDNAPNKTSSSKKKKKHMILSSDSEESQEESVDCTPWPGMSLIKQSAAKKVKRQLALGQSLGQSSDCEGPLSPNKAFMDHHSSADECQLMITKNLDLVEQEDEGEGDDEESESGSDMSDFVVDDSQSAAQEVTAALSALKKPNKKEAYKRLVQLTLSNHLESDFLSSLEDDQDCYRYFDQAKEVIEKIIESKKNLVGSTAWSQSGFKDMLENCCFLESETLPDIIQDTTCEACQFHPRNLSECMIFYEECNGEKVTPPEKEFSVGCFCADRGSIYHDLHHHDFELKRSCADKINKVREVMGIQRNEDIVEYCINDKEWLKSLFKIFETLLNAADQWAVDGKKRKHMKAYCAGFH